MRLRNDLDLSNPEIQKYIHYFAIDTTERILRNMRTLKINPYNPDGKYSGDLMRSIYWTIHRNAGGDDSLISFYYMNYGRYVEIAVGNGLKYQKIPALTKETGLSQVPRPDRMRNAKPFLTSEIRLHARMLIQKLATRMAYSGSIYIMSALESFDSEKEKKDRGWIKEITTDAKNDGVDLKL